MKKKLTILTLVCLLFTLFSLSQAQQQSDEQVLARIDTGLVAIDVIVTNEQGEYLRDLKIEDFEIIEDGVARKIEFFQNVSTIGRAPLAMVFALDLSGSLSADETVKQRDSIKQFIRMLDTDSVCALVGFNYKIDVLQDFTRDHKKLAKKLDDIKDYGGSTRIYDAIDRSLTLFKKAPTFRQGRRMRHVVVVVTDGFDSASVIDKKELVRRANLGGVSIFSVTLPSFAPSALKGGSKERVPTLLDISRITDLTGGRDFTVDKENFTEVFEAIAKEVGASYTLAYHPPKEGRTTEFHKLEVRVKRPGARIRASRDGFALTAASTK